MPRVLVSENVKRRQWATPSMAGEVKYQRGVIALDATALAATDVLDACVLPPHCVPVDAIIDTDDLDSNGAPTLTLDVGLISGIPGDTTFANRVVGTEIGNNLTTAQAAALARNALQGFMRLAPQPVDRSIGFKVEGAPATAVVRTGTLTVNRGLWQPGTQYVANDYIVLPDGTIFECTTGGVSGVYGQTEKEAPSQQQPNWNVGFGLTTTDGGVTWTCRTPVIALTIAYRAARDRL